MSKQPLISVVTAVRNAETHIANCLKSVEAQGSAVHEHWVMDGASTDHTVDILRETAGSRCRWTSEPDAGVYDAMNKAVRQSSGDWIIFLGVDDLLRPGILRQMSTQLVDPHTIYYGDVWMTGRQVRYAGRFSRFRLARKNICQQAIFYPKAVFEAYAFDPSYCIQADWVLNMACRQDGRFRFEYVPLVIADYNDLTGLSSRCRDPAMERDYLLLLHRFFPPVISWPWSMVVLAGRWIKRVCRWNPHLKENQ